MKNRGWLVVLGVLVVLGGGMAMSYNRFVSMDVGVKAAWAQVENQLQRRSDLIPNLVNSVKGYAAHEQGIFEEVANARAKLAGAGSVPDKVDAANALNSALGRLLAIAENYPQLKADANFRQLMDELAGTENRIAVERMRYNERVGQYNTALRHVPGNLVAAWFHFQPAVFFEAAPGAKTVPEVKF